MDQKGVPVSEAVAAIMESAVADTREGAVAHVVFEGEALEFRVPPPDPDSFSYWMCTNLAGSLQGSMQLVDEQGEPVDGGELTFFLLEPGGIAEQNGEIAEFRLELPDEIAPAPLWSYSLVEIDATVDGRSVSGGSFTLDQAPNSAPLSGTFDIAC